MQGLLVGHALFRRILPDVLGDLHGTEWGPHLLQKVRFSLPLEERFVMKFPRGSGSRLRLN
jgi:hypothetical protein